MNLRSVIMALALALCACGGKKDSGDLNKTLDELAKAKDDATRAKNALDKCTKDFADYKATNSGGPQEIVVRVDGSGVTIVGRVATGPGSVGSGDLTEAEKNVVPLVVAQIQQSKNAIQQCYVQALKTTAGLEARTIKLAVQVKVNPTGVISDAQFAPDLSPSFTTCMNKVAERWKIKEYQGRAFPVQYPITLQPVQ
jgi:hypothetical protein